MAVTAFCEPKQIPGGRLEYTSEEIMKHSDRINYLISRALHMAAELVNDKLRAIEAVGHALLADESLTGSQVAAIVERCAYQ